MKEPKLTDKQIVYVSLRSRGHTPTESVFQAFKPSSKLSASVMGNKLEKMVKIKLAINEELLKNYATEGVSPDFVIQGLKSIAINGEIESNKVRCFELLGKTFAMFRDKLETEDLTEKPEPALIRGKLASALSLIEKTQPIGN